jgi:hypothetical protein
MDYKNIRPSRDFIQNPRQKFHCLRSAVRFGKKMSPSGQSIARPPDQYLINYYYYYAEGSKRASA